MNKKSGEKQQKKPFFSLSTTHQSEINWGLRGWLSNENFTPLPKNMASIVFYKKKPHWWFVGKFGTNDGK